MSDNETVITWRTPMGDSALRGARITHYGAQRSGGMTLIFDGSEAARMMYEELTKAGKFRLDVKKFTCCRKPGPDGTFTKYAEAVRVPVHSPKLLHIESLSKDVLDKVDGALWHLFHERLPVRERIEAVCTSAVKAAAAQKMKSHVERISAPEDKNAPEAWTTFEKGGAGMSNKVTDDDEHNLPDAELADRLECLRQAEKKHKRGEISWQDYITALNGIEDGLGDSVKERHADGRGLR